MKQNRSNTQRPTAPPTLPNVKQVDDLSTLPHKGEQGQALVEYVLIVVLLALGFGFALAITGPAIGNVFNNVLYQFVGQDPSLPVNEFSAPGEGGSPADFWATVTWVAQVRQTETPFPTPVSRPTLVGGPSGGGDTATPSRTPTNTPSITPSITSSPTSSLTPSMTPTHTYTPSPGPSPTPPDKIFDVPHVDQMGNPDWWRLQRANAVPELGIDWNATYYENIGSYSSGATAFTYSPPSPAATVHAPPGWTNGGIGEYWGTGPPAGITGSDTFAAVYSKTVNLITPISMSVILRVDTADAARFSIDGTLIASRYNTTTATIVNNITLTAGTHTFLLEYADNTGSALAEMQFTNLTRYNSPDDNRSGCTWNVLNDTDTLPTNNTVSTAWMFAQDPSALLGNGAAYAASQTCYLEMRGYVDLAGTTKPTLSFWDYWQLPNGISASLQIGRYVEVVPGAIPPSLVRPSLNWQTIAMRTGGTTNYNWTRNALDLTSYIATFGDNKVTFRFVLQNTTGAATSGVHRWFLDDLQVLEMEDITPGVNEYFTVNDNWDFDTRDQMDDFVFDADSLRTLEVTGGDPAQLNGSSQWRWNLTSTRPRGGSGMSWDDSPGFNHVERMHSSATSPRISFLEFKYPINLTSGIAPAADVLGNSGRAILTFYTTYAVGSTADIQIEYTTTPPNVSTTLRNWQTVPADGRLRRSGGCTTCDVNEQTAADITGSGYRQVIVRMDQIPNWSTQPFYLRLALYGRDVSAEGWYIDDMSILREAGAAFMAYPFADDVENPAFTSVTWNFLNGTWASTNEQGSFANSGSFAYTDSPAANYAASSNRWMETRQWLDLNYDTLENINNPGTLGEPARASGAASNPTLTFMHQRRTETGASFLVEINVASNPATWYTVWRYDDSSSKGASNWSRIQDTWERVEIDLAAGLQTALGSPYSSLIADANLLNDDIRIRFRMLAGATQANGVYIDAINLGNRVDFSHRLWGTTPFGVVVTGAGDGVYEDRIEFASRGNNASTEWDPITTPVDQRWYASGAWAAVNDGAAYSRSSSLAFAESSPPATAYGFNTENFLELRPIIDLRGTDAVVDRPMLTFWARYNIGDDDRLRVQIATEQVGDLTQSHDDMAGWSRWEPNRMQATAYQFATAPIAYWHRINSTLTNGSYERRDTWQFYQVDLSAFAATASVAGKRIRVRFMLDSDYDLALSPPRGDGWYIDNVNVRYGHPNLQPVTGWSEWNDNGSIPDNWIREGDWGVSQQYTVLGSGTEALGVGQWRGMIFDCETLNNPGAPLASAYPDSDCTGGSGNTPYEYIMSNLTNPTGSPPYAAGIYGPYNQNSITYLDNFDSPDGSVNVGSEFDDTFAMRFTRTVNLTPGQYRFETYSDDGVRLRVSSATGITGLLSGNYIINNWTNHSNTRNEGIIQVTANISVTLTLEYYERSGNAVLQFGASKDDYAYTDSPNTENAVAPGGYDVVNSIQYGDSSLMLNGYFNLSSPAPTHELTYNLIWTMLAGQNFYLDTSTDGGFTWSNVVNETISGSSSDMQPFNTRTVSLPQSANVMFRFRMNTTAGSATGDGVWIDDIKVRY